MKSRESKLLAVELGYRSTSCRITHLQVLTCVRGAPHENGFENPRQNASGSTTLPKRPPFLPFPLPKGMHLHRIRDSDYVFQKTTEEQRRQQRQLLLIQGGTACPCDHAIALLFGNVRHH